MSRLAIQGALLAFGLSGGTAEYDKITREKPLSVLPQRTRTGTAAAVRRIFNFILPSAEAAEAPARKPLDLIIAVDFSASFGADERQAMLKRLEQLFSFLQPGKDFLQTLMFGLPGEPEETTIGFGDETITENTRADRLTELGERYARDRGIHSDLLAALQGISKMITQKDGDKNHVVVLVTDGEPDTDDDVAWQRYPEMAGLLPQQRLLIYRAKLEAVLSALRVHGVKFVILAPQDASLPDLLTTADDIVLRPADDTRKFTQLLGSLRPAPPHAAARLTVKPQPLEQPAQRPTPPQPSTLAKKLLIASAGLLFVLSTLAVILYARKNRKLLRTIEKQLTDDRAERAELLAALKTATEQMAGLKSELLTAFRTQAEAETDYSTQLRDYLVRYFTYIEARLRQLEQPAGQNLAGEIDKLSRQILGLQTSLAEQLTALSGGIEDLRKQTASSAARATVAPPQPAEAAPAPPPAPPPVAPPRPPMVQTATAAPAAPIHAARSPTVIVNAAVAQAPLAHASAPNEMPVTMFDAALAALGQTVGHLKHGEKIQTMPAALSLAAEKKSLPRERTEKTAEARVLLSQLIAASKNAYSLTPEDLGDFMRLMAGFLGGATKKSYDGPFFMRSVDEHIANHLNGKGCLRAEGEERDFLLRARRKFLSAMDQRNNPFCRIFESNELGRSMPGMPYIHVPSMTATHWLKMANGNSQCISVEGDSIIIDGRPCLNPFEAVKIVLSVEMAAAVQ